MKYPLYTSKKILCTVLLAVLLLSLVPLLALSFYSYPAVDDFSYGLYTHHAWVETGSLIRVLKYAVGEVKDTYQNWQGTYAAVGLFSLHPGIFGEQWYFLTAFFILGALIAGSAALCRVLVYDLLGGDRYDWGIVTSMLLLLSIQCMPSLSQGIYWFNGGSFYLFFHAAMLLYLASMLRLCLGRVHPLRIGWCALLGVALGGGNYASALLSLELSALLLCFEALFFSRRRAFCCWPRALRSARLRRATLCAQRSIRGLHRWRAFSAPLWRRRADCFPISGRWSLWDCCWLRRCCSGWRNGAALPSAGPESWPC